MDIKRDTLIADIIEECPQAMPAFMPSECTAWAAPSPAARLSSRPAMCTR